MLSLKPFILHRLRWIQSILGNERTGMKEIMDGEIYVWQSCVEIEGYSITSSSPRSKCRTAELLSSLLRVSAPCSRVLLHCEVACLSLAVWTVCLARPLSLHFLTPLYRSLSEQQHIEICLSFLGRLQSSVTSCSCTSLTWALLELVWVSMGNKTCNLKREGKTLTEVGL